MLTSKLKRKIEFLVETQLWPTEPLVNVESWLQNFKDDETEYALHLLDSFQYFSDRFVKEMLRANYERLSSKVVTNASSTSQSRSIWLDFQQNCYWTYISGETENVTDSGYQMLEVTPIFWTGAK